MDEIAFLKQKFGEYYQTHRIEVLSVEKREFGFGSPEKKIETRHMHFGTNEQLQSTLMRVKPFYVSYSAAYYEFPEARPMIRKNWQGADLIFDLDAPAHSCGKFTCRECLGKIKEQTIRLVEEFLTSDFGIPKSEISVNFSGNRGYHVHVRSKDFVGLKREERRELVDYITGTGVSIESFFYKDGKIFKGPTPTQGGYGGKIARAIVNLLDNDEKFRALLSRRLKDQKVLEAYKRGIYEGKYGMSGKLEKFTEALKANVSMKLSEDTDANVTIDTTKLIRLPNSIHGGSGLVAKTTTPERLAGFDPFVDAVAFSQGSCKVRTLEAVPAISISGGSFGPYAAGESLEVPMAAGVYLLCKKACALIS